MRRNFFRPLWVILALLLLLEAWLWDHLEPIVARVVNVVPWGRVKTVLARLIEKLPPYASLIVFIIPVIVVLLPLKFLEVYFIATHNWIGAIVVLVFAKLLGLGVTAFVFDVTRGKLLQIAWFRRHVRLVHMGRATGRARNHRADPAPHSKNFLVIHAGTRRSLSAPAHAIEPRAYRNRSCLM